MTTTNDDLATALARLPRDVRSGIKTLSPEEQRAYLESLDRMADMETKGETFLPKMADPEAPYGRRRDGSPKAKPGRRPAANPGQRTQERSERFRREDLDLEEILASLPEGDEPITFANYPGDPETPELAPQVPTPVDREAAEREAYERELADALEKAGRTTTGREIVSREFTGQRRVELEDPDDPLAIATVETCTYRVTADDQEYHLEQLIGDTWQSVSRAYDLTFLAFHLAFRRVVVDFADTIKGVPRYRPDRQRYMSRMFKPEPPPATPEERAQRDSEIRAEMGRRRRARGSAPYVGSWM
jgi:hypothetical protein